MKRKLLLTSFIAAAVMLSSVSFAGSDNSPGNKDPLIKKAECKANPAFASEPSTFVVNAIPVIDVPVGTDVAADIVIAPAPAQALIASDFTPRISEKWKWRPVSTYADHAYRLPDRSVTPFRWKDIHRRLCI